MPNLVHKTMALPVGKFSQEHFGVTMSPILWMALWLWFVNCVVMIARLQTNPKGATVKLRKAQVALART